SKNLNALLATITNIFSHTHKEIKFDQEIEAELWNTNIDEAQIELVLFNLFFNAKQAMPTGGSLSLRTKNVTVSDNFGIIHEVTPGRFVKLSVTDTGVGMDRETQRRIFDPFFSTRGMTEGTGLGLASAYGIIRKHEGIITVESEIGRGTTFDIYLPALDREHVETAESATAEVRQGVGTILFVDDEEDLLTGSRRALEGLGYDALVASSGAKALEIYRQNMGRVDLVILDMIMPEMGGGEVFDKLRKLNPSVRVLLSSGYSLDGQAQEIMERGCDAFIQKPFDMETLSRKINEVLIKR
ncbi:MAG: response regulator, partial [bacterium]